MLTTAGQATDRWWPLPGSSVSTSALQLLAGRPRDNSATGSPIHLHNIYLSTYLHIYTMKHTWPGVSITDHTGQWPGPKQCWFMRVIHVIEFSPNIFTVYLHTVMHALVNIGLTKLSLSYQEDTPYTWKWRKTKTLLNCSRVFSSSIHCKLSKSTNIKYGPI